MPLAIVHCGTLLLGGSTTDGKFIAAPLKLSTSALSKQVYSVDCGTTFSFVSFIGGDDYEPA